MPFDIKGRRSEIEREYIGFAPSTTRVRPSHLANGMFRTLIGETYDTSTLFRFVVTAKHDGSIPYGHERTELYEELSSKGRIDVQAVSSSDVERLRLKLRKIVSADGTVYIDKEKTAKRAGSRFDSYTGGSRRFLSTDRSFQDAGEFLATWMKRDAPDYCTTIVRALDDTTDTITLIAYPLLQEHTSQSLGEIGEIEETGARSLRGRCPQRLKEQMRLSSLGATTLSSHMAQHPDKLFRLRMAMMYGAFSIIRYLADLEYGYGLAERRPPMLLDFSGAITRPIRMASESSYISLCRSLSRYYTWMLGDFLRDNFAETVSLDVPPTYGKKVKDSDLQLYDEIWKTSLNEAQESEDKYQVLGQAIYDILAMDANATPINYFKQIGLHSGLFWPPSKFVTAKHLTPRRDLLEVFVRSVVQLGETIDLGEIQQRLRHSYGIIIGGLPDDIDYLLDSGIYQADAKALEENQMAFADQLKDLNFARHLADGVLEVQVG